MCFQHLAHKRGAVEVFDYRKFDVKLSREVRFAELSWPEPGEAADENCLGCNREYIDLRLLSWAEAKRTLVAEGRLIARIEQTEELENSVFRAEEDEEAELFGLDTGVASTVVALSAARCVPFSSCNGGAFGSRHHEIYPLVAFYAKPETANLLLAIAGEVCIGLETNGYGFLVLYSDDIRKFPKFAEAMISRRKDLNALQLSPKRKPRRPIKLPRSGQLELMF